MPDSESQTYTAEDIDRLVQEKLATEREALLANRNEALDEAKRAKKLLAKYEGVDPDEFKRLKEAAAQAERKKAEAEGDFRALEKQLVERHTQELKAKDDRAAKLQRALEKRLVEAQLAAELAKAELADPTFMPLLMLEGQRHVKVRETDDDFEAFVADEHGQPLVADGRGTPMTVGDYVQQTLRSQYPPAFRGTGSSGGGAVKSAPGGGGARVVSVSDNSAFLANLEGIAHGSVQVRE